MRAGAKGVTAMGKGTSKPRPAAPGQVGQQLPSEAAAAAAVSVSTNLAARLRGLCMSFKPIQLSTPQT